MFGAQQGAGGGPVLQMRTSADGGLTLPQKKDLLSGKRRIMARRAPKMHAQQVIGWFRVLQNCLLPGLHRYLFLCF